MTSMFSSFWKSSSDASGPGGSGSGSFPFDVGPEVGSWSSSSSCTTFSLHEAKHKSTQQPVSVFVCDTAAALPSASSAVRRLKTLRHPAVLTFLDSVEQEGKSVQVATEKVQVLSAHLDSLDRLGVRGPARDHYLAWGLFQVMRGLAFLNMDAKLRHNALRADAIYVNEAGDWKLFGLEHVSSTDAELTPLYVQDWKKYDAPEANDASKRNMSTVWSRDMWGMGCVVWEVFNGRLPAARNLGQLGSIPKKLTPLYMELVAANPAKRPNPKERLETLRRGGNYFKNDLIDLLIFLEELQIKEDSEKARFYTGLLPLFDSIPAHVCTHKILPELIKAFEFGNAGAAIIAPVLKLGKGLESEEYVRKVVPCVVKLFASNDRNARFKLLSQVEHFVEHLNDKVANDDVFPHIQNGFLDQEPIIREKTVIATIHLAPKLTFANLDETVVMRHFSRLLRDEQAGIRTNTTVCLGKIARYLHYSTRQKVLIAAFTGKLRDPFPPARIAAINALAATQQFYTIAETAGRVLPALCVTLTDPEGPVRQQGFKVTRGFLDKLEQVSKDPSLREEMEADVLSTNSNSKLAAAAGWASWAVGAIGAKFYKSAAPAPAAKAAASAADAAGDTKAGGSKEGEKPMQATMASTSRQEEKEDEAGGDDDGGDNGWDNDDADDWGSLDDSATTTAMPTSLSNSSSNNRRSLTPKMDELSLEEDASYGRAPQKHQAIDEWNSWGGDDDQDDEDAQRRSREEERRQREEKRAAKRAEMAAKREARKGPMKLGAKKL